MTPAPAATEKKKFPLAVAKRVARHLINDLVGCYEKLKIAGSVRREKEEVGDLELLIIPQMGIRNSGDLFGTSESYSRTADRIDQLVDIGRLEYRENAKGSTTNGEKIKLLRDRAEGIPIDIFLTTKESWYNYLVCRTGPKESNMAIAKRAQSMGLKWEPYSSGFLDKASGNRIVCESEREVFDTVDMPYRDPEIIARAASGIPLDNPYR